MANVHKIFVEPDEEIVFTIEKIVKGSETRAILVVPKNAALVSSAVSLKLLTKQMLRTDKLAVLVTEDEIGRRLADKASLVAVSKISEVTKEIWGKAKELKEMMQAEKERVREELVGSRKEEKVEEEPEISKEPVKAVVEDDDKLASVAENRVEPKKIELDGVLLVAGGDITDDLDLMEEERIRLEQEPDADKYLEQPKVSQAQFKRQDKNLADLKRKADNAKQSDDESPKKALIGRDLTAMMTPKEPKRTNRKSQKAAVPPVVDKAKAAVARFFSGGGNKKLLQAFAIGLLLFFLISYLFFPSVTIVLEFAENEVRINEIVTAQTGLETIDTEQLKIPANLLSKTNSVKKDGDATGTGETGEKAKGLVDIYNNTDDGITIASGTTLTNISTDLKYTLTREVTIPASDRVEDVSIEASSFGENYNIVGNSADYVVGGYNTSQVIAKSFRDIEGGTTEEVVVVSQQDIDAIKSDAIEELKSQLLDNVNGLISEEDILLDGSQKFREDEVKTSVKAGEEADSFTVEVKMTLSALTVLKSDLSAVAEEVAKREDGSEGASISITDPIVRDIDVTANGKQATFSLSSKAGVTADIDENELKETLAGVSVADAHEYLDDFEGVDHKIKYSPIYIPYFLQRIPSDFNKISVEKSFISADE